MAWEKAGTSRLLTIGWGKSVETVAMAMGVVYKQNVCEFENLFSL